MTWMQLIWRYLTIQRGLALALLATAVGSAVVDVTLPWLLQEAIDAAMGVATQIGFGYAIAGIVVVAIAAGIGHGLALWFESRLFSEASADLRRQLILNCFQQPLGALQRHHSAELVHRMSASVSQLEQLMVELFSELPFAILVSSGVLVMMAMIDLRLTGMVVGLLVVAGLLTERISVRNPSLQRLTQVLGARLAAMLHESLAAMRIIKAHGAEREQVGRMEFANSRILAAGKAAGNLRAITTPMWGVVEILAVALVLGYGGQLLIAGEITIGTLVAFMTYMELLAAPVHRAGEYYYQIQTCRATAQRIVAILAVPIEQSAESRFACDTRDCAIILDNVTFAYPGSSKTALNGFSLRVLPGEFLAIAGRNGAGKSTLLDLLLRFQQPQKGRILVGGVDLADWDLSAWRKQVGMVPQDSLLLSGTVGENIALGVPDAKPELICEALQQACGADWRARFPDGIDTIVGERGTRLSGGERQLIALARVFFRDSRIVLLDEPTAHLDGETLTRVDEAIRRLTVGRTIILISHRPETTHLASRIAVVDKGRVADEGDHEYLTHHSSLYRDLLNSGDVASKERLELVPAAGIDPQLPVAKLVV